MSKSQSWIRDRIGSLLVGLLVCSFLLAMAGLAASIEPRRKMAAFESDGQTAIGTITNRYAGTAGGQANRFDVTFVAQGGMSYGGYATVTDPNDERLAVGGHVKVTYVRSHPDWFYIGDNAPPDQDAAVFSSMFRYGTLASLLLLLAITTSAYWNPVARPENQSPATARSGVSFRDRRLQLSTGFGKRDC